MININRYITTYNKLLINILSLIKIKMNNKYTYNNDINTAK